MNIGGFIMDNTKCFFCGGQLIWRNDFSTEDYGIDEEGIVSVLCCSECKASWKGVQIFKDMEDLKNE